jgi:hypothetical protein
MTTLRLSARAFASHLPDRWLSPASVALGVVGLAYVPLLMVYARELWNLADYRFFPLLIIAALAVSARRWRDVASVEAGRVVFGPLPSCPSGRREKSLDAVRSWSAFAERMGCLAALL